MYILLLSSRWQSGQRYVAVQDNVMITLCIKLGNIK